MPKQPGKSQATEKAYEKPQIKKVVLATELAHLQGCKAPQGGGLGIGRCNVPIICIGLLS